MFFANTQASVALVVRDPFANYKRGHLILDPEKIQQILSSDQARHVIKRLVLTTPELEQPVEADEKPFEPIVIVKAVSHKTPKKPKE